MRRPPRTCSSTCAIRWPRRAPFPTPPRSSSSACATSSATGASACCRRAADAFTRRGRWRPPRRIREETGVDVETLWGDDGFVVRFPDVDQPPDPRLLLPDPGRGAGARRPAAGRDGAVRRQVPRERRALAAAAEAPPRHARAALAAAQARRRSAGRRLALRIVSGPARNLSRVPARLLRHAGARRDARRRPEPEDSRRHRRLGEAVAVRGVAALQLRRELPVRRRRAAGGAARPGAGRRSGAAARAARRRRASRTARRRRDRRGRAPAAAARPALSREERRRACTTCCCRSAISPPRKSAPGPRRPKSPRAPSARQRPDAR